MVDNYKKIKVVIVDDEPQCILRLQTDLTALGDFEVVATSSSPASAKALVAGVCPDVLFIDVEMPGQTGFEVLRSFSGDVPPSLMVVFYSAFDKYMIDALRASAFDFLLKPYLPEEFDVVVARVRERMAELGEAPFGGVAGDAVGNAAQGFAPDLAAIGGMEAKRTAIQTVCGLLMVKPGDVFCCSFDEANHIWRLRMANGDTHSLKRQMTAKGILSMSPSLVQVRQDCIINLDFLVSIENNSLRCVFAPPFDKERVYVSRRYYKGVKDKLEIL